jgi:hypothetical protein
MKKKNLTQELREFGYLMGVMLILIFGLILPGLFDKILGQPITLLGVFTTPIWPWLSACCFWLPALLWPKSLQAIYFVWMKIGAVLAWINTRIIMLLMFYGMMVPIGLILRLLGKDAMYRKKQVKSYRVICKPIDKNHLERPY